jgi:hypothetical protein
MSLLHMVSLDKESICGLLGVNSSAVPTTISDTCLTNFGPEPEVLMLECCVVMIQVSIVVWQVACATGVVICHWGVT